MLKDILRTAYCVLRYSTYVSLLFFTSLCAETSIGVEVKLSAGELPSLGEPFNLTYTIKLPSNLSLDLSQWRAGKTEFGEFILWDFKTSPAKTQDQDIQTIDLNLGLLPITIGKSEIPDLKIPYKDPQTPTAGEFIKTPPIPIEITDPTIKSKNPNQLRDIKAPRKPLYFWEHPLFITAVILFAAMSIVGLLFMIYSKKKRQRILEEELKKLTPEEAFEKFLNDLLSSGLLEQMRLREFYFSLSDIFRNYLDRRFTLETETLTSRELFKLLYQKRHDLQIDLKILLKLKETFEVIDLAKFAKYAPPSQETNQIMDTLKEFVEIHKPKPIETESPKQEVLQ